MIQKSTSFILPMYKLPSYCRATLESTYLGNIYYEGTQDWGNYFYLEYKRVDLDNNITATIRENLYYIVEFDHEESVFFVLEIPKRYKEGVVDPFLKGEYSKIDRAYVARFFPQRLKDGNTSSN